MTDAFKDLSMNALKAAASMLFKKWLGSKKFQDNLGQKIEEYMQKNFRNLMDTKMNNLQEDWAQKLHSVSSHFTASAAMRLRRSRSAARTGHTRASGARRCVYIRIRDHDP